jgi:hypothetical protein
MGHTLVHYLYTGTYQALRAKGEVVASPVHVKFEQALLTFVLASAYKLPGLEKLAKQQIETCGRRMALVEILDAARKEFSNVAGSWFHEYLQARAKEQFDLDHTLLASTAFIENMGNGTLYQFMTPRLLQMFSKRLTHTLQSLHSHSLGKEKPAAVLDIIGVQTPKSPIEEVLHLVVRDIDEEQEEWLVEEVEDARLAKEAEEKAERKKKEEEDATAAAAASAAADLSWAEPAAPANDDWGSFAATTTTGKKKKGKKGKVRDRGYEWTSCGANQRIGGTSTTLSSSPG